MSDNQEDKAFGRLRSSYVGQARDSYFGGLIDVFACTMPPLTLPRRDATHLNALNTEITAKSSMKLNALTAMNPNANVDGGRRSSLVAWPIDCVRALEMFSASII